MSQINFPSWTHWNANTSGSEDEDEQTTNDGSGGGGGALSGNAQSSSGNGSFGGFVSTFLPGNDESNDSNDSGSWGVGSLTGGGSNDEPSGETAAEVDENSGGGGGAFGSFLGGENADGGGFGSFLGSGDSESSSASSPGFDMSSFLPGNDNESGGWSFPNFNGDDEGSGGTILGGLSAFGGDNQENSGGGLGAGLGAAAALGGGVTANDLMGGNACTWNRREILSTEGFSGTVGRLWSSLTENGTTDFGRATATPLSGQYEENFWLPYDACLPSDEDASSCFVRGMKSDYELPCVVQDATLLQEQFETENGLVTIDFEDFSCSAPVPQDQYVVGALLLIEAKAEVDVVDEIVDHATIDLHKDNFVLKSCEMSLLTSDSPLAVGDTFEYNLLLLDRQPSMQMIILSGIIGGSLLMLICCGTFVYCCCCQKKRKVKKLFKYADIETGEKQKKIRIKRMTRATVTEPIDDEDSEFDDDGKTQKERKGAQRNNRRKSKQTKEDTGVSSSSEEDNSQDLDDTMSESS